MIALSRFCLCLAAAVSMLFFAPAPALAQTAVQAGRPVRVEQDRETFTLSNGIITAIVSKRSGDLVSMTYNGVETLSADAGGHSAAYWSHDVTGGVDVVSRISIDPASNGGARAEVSVKGISGGRKMGHGPGTAPDGDFPVDIDIRYSMGRGERGLYTYTAFDHRPEYPGATMAEARIAIELAPFFDDIHVDDMRSGRYPLIEQDADKYIYVTRQADERAYGWTSSTQHIGWFLLNPSAEYLSGGPNKAEFTAHGEPTVLNYWKSSHYGGANVTVAAGEHWTRVVGPFVFYVNEGDSHAAMIADARAQLAREEARWPYDWVVADGYAPPATRSTVVGQIALHDPQSPTGDRYSGNLMVGLTQTPYTLPPPPENMRLQMQGDGRFRSTTIDWQNDGKFYQFWSRNTDPAGRFSIQHVPPGRYTLYAYADGVLGEFSKADVVVGERGGRVDLGRLVWTPVRNGRQLWEVGVSDRSAMEFRHAERYFEPGVQLRYPELFPNGVTFRIGQSRTNRDWFFAHVPTVTADSNPVIRPISGVAGNGAATPYAIVFDLARAPRGAATLRLALTAGSSSRIEVAVNGVGAGAAPVVGPSDGAIMRHQMYGRFSETSLTFDARLLRRGENTLTLTIPEGSFNAGVIYDYLRLELDEAAAPPVRPIIEASVTPRPAPAATPPAPAPITPDVETIHDDARLGLPDQIAGGRRFFAHDGGLYVQRGGARARLLVDPRSFDGGVLGEWRVSPDGRRLAYGVAESAAPDAWRRIRVVDTQTRSQIEDDVRARLTAIAWAQDGSGFYYSRTPETAEAALARFFGPHEVYFHTIGRPRHEDRRVLWSDRPGMIHYAETTDDGRWLVVNGSVRGDGKADITLIDLTHPHPAPFKAMRTMQNWWRFAGSRGDLIYFVTDFGAERRRLVAIDSSLSSLPIVEVVPQTDNVLEGARILDGKLYLAYDAGENARLVVVDLPARPL